MSSSVCLGGGRHSNTVKLLKFASSSVHEVVSERVCILPTYHKHPTRWIVVPIFLQTTVQEAVFCLDNCCYICMSMPLMWLDLFQRIEFKSNKILITFLFEIQEYC